MPPPVLPLHGPGGGEEEARGEEEDRGPGEHACLPAWVHAPAPLLGMNRGDYNLMYICDVKCRIKLLK